jgi:hypothetical protein
MDFKIQEKKDQVSKVGHFGTSLEVLRIVLLHNRKKTKICNALPTD